MDQDSRTASRHLASSEPGALVFRWVGTSDNLVVRPAMPRDLATVLDVLAEARLGPVDRVRVSGEVLTARQAMWVVVERPRRAVGLVRVLVDPSVSSGPVVTMVQSRRWGDQRQAREAIGVVVGELSAQGTASIWAGDHDRSDVWRRTGFRTAARRITRGALGLPGERPDDLLPMHVWSGGWSFVDLKPPV